MARSLRLLGVRVTRDLNRVIHIAGPQTLSKYQGGGPADEGGIMRSMNIIKKGFASMFGAMVVFAGVSVVMAQDSPRDEWEEWQSARRELMNEQREYQRNPSRDNWRGLQDAIRDEQRERAEYQIALARRGGRWDPRMNNTVVFNDGRVFDDGGVVVRTNPRGMFRLNRGGTFITVNQGQMGVLRQAINQGYQQGYMAGLNDRRFGRGFSYHNNSMFRTGVFGHVSLVPRNTYSYYFQQGFQRGYEDGYYSRSRFGVRTGTGFNILGSVVNTILNIADAVDDDDDFR